jgi:hypothetical protein
LPKEERAVSDGLDAPELEGTAGFHGRNVRAWAFRSLSRYFRAAPDRVASLGIPHISWPESEELPPRLAMVDLPGFAGRAAVSGGLLVPAWSVGEGEGPPWRRTDWLSAAAWYLHGAAEREHERGQGPIHSYSLRLAGFDARMWERAWVNRIGLFLRAWAAHEIGLAEDALGPLPVPTVHLTHDVDYLSKTPAVRAKQGAFELFKAARALGRGDARGLRGQLGRALRFMLSSARYDLCQEVADRVAARGAVSSFFFYGGGGGLARSPLLQLLDPSYDVRSPRWAALTRWLRERGFTVGLHQSFGSWGGSGKGSRSGSEPMLREKLQVERALGRPVVSCRQHWLRFAWDGTWKAQAEAGLRFDATLGFNDRPAFRNASAMRFFPFDPQTGKELPLTALPMLFMDSHFFDYADLSGERRRHELSRWMAEVRDVSGEISVLWHPYVLSSDFGRGELFNHLLDELGGFETRVDFTDV